MKLLSRSKVIYFIKQKLGFPHVAIELSDDQMWDYIKNFTIVEFSKYRPDVQEMVLNTKDPKNKTHDDFVFLLHEPEGAQILNVVEVIRSQTSLFIMGYPYQGPLTSYDALPSNVAAAEQAETTEQFSNNLLNWLFMPPNRLRINVSMLPNKVVVRYSRVQPESLYYVPAEYEPEFLYLCLSDIMNICGNIRGKYSNLSTPFGDIPISGDLASAAENLKSNVISRLEQLPPNCFIHVG